MKSKPGRVDAGDIIRSVELIHEYVVPYQEALVRSEQREHFTRMVTGLASNLERKSVEPIARMHGLPRRDLQRFVGENGWSHEPLVQQLRKEIAAELGSPEGQVVVDGSGVAKKGTETVGVKRQYLGCSGKVDNGVMGVYAVYVGRSEQTAIAGAELYLPKEWCDDPGRREKAYVPKKVTYRSQPEIARDLLVELAGEMPFGWVGGDDEFGRVQMLRDQVRTLGKNYVFDVPCDTRVRTVDSHGRMRDTTWRIDRLIRQRRGSEWEYFYARHAEKGPIKVRALKLRVVTHRTSDEWVEEVLLVVEEVWGEGRWTYLGHAPEATPLTEWVRRAMARHRIEEAFAEAKGEVGFDHYEVRSWHGWYHHMTLGQIAHWFLVRERRRLGKKSAGPNREHDPRRHRSAADASPQPTPVSSRDQLPPSTERGSPPWSLPGHESRRATAPTARMMPYVHVAQ
jgi:SRSO17 transposase